MTIPQGTRASRLAGRVLVGVALTVAVLAGCGTDEPEPAAVPPATEPTSTSAAFLEPGLRFSEEADQAYLKELAKLDKQLAEDDDALVNGRTICLELAQGKTNSQITKDAAVRFEVDDATAQQIVQAAKASMCNV